MIGSVSRMDGWMDGQSRGEGREVSSQNQKREGNKRVSRTTVVGVCFIDCTG